MLLFMVLEFGLAWVLLYFRLMAMRSGHPAVWLAAYRFWVRVFALAFVLCFAAGLPALIQFGSLWPGLLGKIADIASPLLAAIILSMFVLKSCFAGSMLFGERRLSAGLHALTVALVAAGTTLSSFFLLALVSWLHTPAGAVQFNGQYVATDPMQILFSPALPWHAVLFVGVALLLTAFLIMAVTAGQAERNPAAETSARVFRVALIMAVGGALLQVFAMVGTGWLAGLHQPALAAALAGYWHSGAAPDLVLAGWPDASSATNRFAWVWSGGAAAWLPLDHAGLWRGLDQFSGMTPPVALTFWSFRIALLVAAAMGLTAGWMALRLRRHGHDPAVLSGRGRALLKAMLAAGVIMVLACMAYVQFGAFPYVVYETITLSVVLTQDLNMMSLLGTSVLYLACYSDFLTDFVFLC